MRHKRIPSSKRHKKIKQLHSIESDDEATEHENPILSSHSKDNVGTLKQSIPRKMQELMRLREESIAIKKKDPKKSRTKTPGLLAIRSELDGDDEGHTRGVKYVPTVTQQGPYESDSQFLHRLSKMASKARSEAKVEAKFNVDFCPKPERVRPKILSTKTGKEVKYTSQGKIHVDPIEVRKSRKTEKRRERAQKLKERKKKKKSKEQSDDGVNLDTWVDHYEFNEVVQAPPAFSKGRRPKFTKT